MLSRCLSVKRALIVCVVVASLAVLTIAAGRLTSSQAPSLAAKAEAASMTNGQTRGENEPSPDWDKPFVDGLPVAAVDQAVGQLPFRAALPSNVGTLKVSYLHESYRPQALGLVYISGPYGRFQAIESKSSMTEAQLEWYAANCDPQRGCEGSWTMETLGTGVSALVIQNPGVVNAALWVHGGRLFNVLGPADTFSLPSLRAVATAFDLQA